MSHAFPTSKEASNGMSFRDYAAVAILQATVARGAFSGDRVADAQRAYQYADSLIAARENRPDEKNPMGAKGS